MKLKLYHGSDIILKCPNYNKGRMDVDFGLGFYTTADKTMAMKWASRKNNPIVNEYELDTNGLKTKHFLVDQEWLDFVIENRNMENPQTFKEYDLLIGATADDKLFSTIEQYEAGFLSTEITLKVLNCMKYSEQYVFKSESSLNNLHFIKAIELDVHTQKQLIEANKKDRVTANKLTESIIRSQNRSRKKRGKSL